MTEIDQFESVFKSAGKTLFQHEDVSIDHRFSLAAALQLGRQRLAGHAAAPRVECHGVYAHSVDRGFRLAAYFGRWVESGRRC